jgi:hypothetical protein
LKASLQAWIVYAPTGLARSQLMAANIQNAAPKQAVLDDYDLWGYAFSDVFLEAQLRI